MFADDVILFSKTNNYLVKAMVTTL